MATFLMFGDYSTEAIKKISAERSKKAIALIEEHGGKLVMGYAMLGKHDLLLVLKLPDVGTAMKVSAGLSTMLGIAFTTSPAVDLDTFDKLMADL
jgi:uncharacterized protein with GYD domain